GRTEPSPSRASGRSHGRPRPGHGRYRASSKRSRHRAGWYLGIDPSRSRPTRDVRVGVVLAESRWSRHGVRRARGLDVVRSANRLGSGADRQATAEHAEVGADSTAVAGTAADVGARVDLPVEPTRSGANTSMYARRLRSATAPGGAEGG